jgi:predicted small lipoprotein YifL
MLSCLPVARLALVAGVLSLSLGACGRRGALEPPPDASAPAQQTGPTQDTTVPSPIGTPRPARRAPIVRPNQPFVLDPIL